MKEKTLLKKARELAGRTQEDVAFAAGISIRAYKQYEAGERLPKVDKAKVIAEVLGRPVEEIF